MLRASIHETKVEAKKLIRYRFEQKLLNVYKTPHFTPSVEENIQMFHYRPVQAHLLPVKLQYIQ